MVARPSTPVRSCNAGEISQAAAGRVDIKQYYSAGLAYKNVEPVPQGGFRQMGGSWRIGRWRKPLVVRAITGGSVAAGPHTGTQTVWTGTVAGTVAAVLVSGFDISAGAATFTVEAQIAGDWVTVGGSFAVGDPAEAETRLAAFAPGEEKTATALRIRATFSTSSTVAISAVAAYHEDGAPKQPRFVALTADDGTAYAVFITEGLADIFTDSGHCGAAWLPDVTEAMLPDLDFYAEANTIGIFHSALESKRILQATDGNNGDWRADSWPFMVMPAVDLGGSYSKQDDVWEIFIRWTGTPQIFLSATVNGETTTAVPISAGGVPIAVTSATTSDMHNWAAAIEDAVQALPSLGAGATVTYQDVDGDNTDKLTFTFGGSLAGREYAFSASITNTTEASALPYHVQIGQSAFEPLWSAARGWPGTADLFQDRMLHGRSPALPGALAMSETGEYFTFNLQSLGDNGARLDKIRSKTSETILATKESQYLLVFTNRAAYFAPNRTIDRNTPVNFVKASETGIQPNCKPFDLEGIDYYVAIHPQGLEYAAEGGKQLLKIVYDDVSTKYNAAPVSLLATHLVDRVLRACRQRPLTDLDAAKGWLMRSDGRLVAGQFIDSQEILGFCEWIAASGGAVREIGIDGLNRLWLAVERVGSMSIELYDTAIYLQDAVSVSPDLAGLVTGLPFEEGAQVWAVADGGYVVGPLTVQAGAVDLADAYETAIVGRWRAPRYESVPQVHVTPSDDVILRPGRIHTLDISLIDTTSLAVGANGEPVEEVALTRADDPGDAPPAPRTEKITVSGITGAMTGTTAVITQLRPGTLRIRDFAMGTKL